MEQSKEEKEIISFSWHSFLFVTSFSLFFFSLVLKFIDGQHINLFLLGGGAALIAGVVAWLGRKP